ncbi:hypothetical protein Ciccas_007138 [Cichlidogyrus casuarinus]|uniref:Uncharacterized protein n=1 Tax=Cichlidogyrus casuarinus TaxID=1844966 RepID=A0ABD2Q407_9PLAT
MSLTRRLARSFSSGCNKISLMGAQVNKGQGKSGVLASPVVLRQCIKEAGIQVEDFGDFVQNVQENDEILKLDQGFARFYKTFLANTLGIANHVQQSLSKDSSRMGLLLGGDHSIGTGGFFTSL